MMMENPSAVETPHRSDDPVARFISCLEQLKRNDDRAALAKLRHSMIDYGRNCSAYTLLGPVLPQKIPQWKMERYLLVAGLFAMHQQSTLEERSLGASLRLLRLKLKGNNEGSLDLLMGIILNASHEDIPVRLRHVITRLASKDVPVNYTRLLRDILIWESPSRHVQRKWAHDYGI